MTEAERIEKDAMKYIDQFNNIAPKSAYKTGYIAGATAERERLQEQLKQKEDDLFVERQLVKVKQKEKEMMAIKLKQKEDEVTQLKRKLLFWEGSIK